MTTKKYFLSEFHPDHLSELFDERILDSHTVGKDGITSYAFSKQLPTETLRINKRVVNCSYKFTPFKQKLILKSADKPPRTISMASVRDRLTLRALTNILTKVFPDAFQPAAHTVIDEIKKQIERRNDDYSFIQIDVENFYPTVVHKHLLRALRARTRYQPLLDLVMKAVSTATGDKTKANTLGIPQGLSISNILSSIYMMEFDRKAKEEFTYFRYVDDILVLTKTSDAQNNYIKLKNSLSKIGLKCHPLEDGKKTKIVPLSHGVEYLGYHIQPDHITVRTSSYRRMIENIMRVVTTAKYNNNQKKVLMRLNLKVTGCIFNGKRMGWMFFFSMTDDMKQLKRLDKFVSDIFKKNFPNDPNVPKRFLKTYYEIKYNLADSKYIPRFDDYTLAQKVSFIATMLNKDSVEIDTWSRDRIEKQFKKLLKKEITELEKDITPVS